MRVWAYPAPADLRKGYNGLYGLVKESLKRDPLSGDLYLFVNRRQTSCKVLLYDGTGLCIYMKRLGKGRFTAPWRSGTGRPLRLTTSELSLFLEGCELVGQRRLSPKTIRPQPLARAVGM